MSTKEGFLRANLTPEALHALWPTDEAKAELRAATVNQFANRFSHVFYGKELREKLADDTQKIINAAVSQVVKDHGATLAQYRYGVWTVTKELRETIQKAAKIAVEGIITEIAQAEVAKLDARIVASAISSAVAKQVSASQIQAGIMAAAKDRIAATPLVELMQAMKEAGI